MTTEHGTSIPISIHRVQDLEKTEKVTYTEIKKTGGNIKTPNPGGI